MKFGEIKAVGKLQVFKTKSSQKHSFIETVVGFHLVFECSINRNE